MLHLFVKRYYKEFLVSLMLLIVASMVYGFNLGSRDLWEDEYQVYDVSYGFSRSGELYKWDWIDNDLGKNTTCVIEDATCNYTRAWTHTVWVGSFLKVFGESVIVARISSIILGIFSSIILYLGVKLFTKNRLLGITSSLIFTLNFQMIEMFRYIRMYSLLAFLTLVFVGFSYWITLQKLKLSVRFISIFCIWLVTTLLLVVTHINALVVILPVILLMVFELFQKSTRKVRVALAVGLLTVGGGLAGSTLLDPGVRSQLSIFGERNFQYLRYILVFSEHFVWGGILLLVGSIGWIQSSYRKLGYWLMLITAFAVMFFVFLAERYTSFQYISHLIGITALLSAGFLWFPLVQKHKVIGVVGLIVILGGMGQTVWMNRGSIYYDDHKYSLQKEGVEILEVLIEEESYQVVALFPREYYLKEISGLEREMITKIPRNREYSLDSLIAQEDEVDQVFFVFESHKGYHIDSTVLAYLESEYTKISGNGLNNSKLEVYVK